MDHREQEHVVQRFHHLMTLAERNLDIAATVLTVVKATRVAGERAGLTPAALAQPGDVLKQAEESITTNRTALDKMRQDLEGARLLSLPR